MSVTLEDIDRAIERVVEQMRFHEERFEMALLRGDPPHELAAVLDLGLRLEPLLRALQDRKRTLMAEEEAKAFKGGPLDWDKFRDLVSGLQFLSPKSEGEL